MQKRRNSSKPIVIINVVSIGGGVGSILKSLSSLLNHFRI